MSTEQTCSSCGGQLLPGDRFCAGCGGAVEPGIEVSTDESSGSLWDPILERLRGATTGKYEIGRVLGTGGMAAVYLGREVRLSRRVAIKVMSPGLMMTPGMVERFHHEAVTIAALSHPNIITIYTVEEANDLHYFVMKYISGPSLETVVRRDGPLPKSVVRVWLTQIASALGYGHRQGVIHRDIKPANILLDDEGNAVVTDFGIAKVPKRSNLTQTGMTLGTPAYMSPEQCTSQEITPASDQYSLGIVTYEMLTGEPPFTGPTLEIMKAHVDKPHRPITAFRPHCPPELVAAVNRMLEKDPASRWRNMEEMMASIGGAPIAHDDPIRAQLAAHATHSGPRSGAPAHGAAEARPRTPPEETARVTPPEETARVAPTPAVVPLPEFLEPEAPPPVASLVIAPAPPSIWEGHTLRLKATALDSAGQPLRRREVTWESSDLDVATVAPDGRAAAHQPGSVTIVAACEGQSDSVTLEVLPVHVESVSILVRGSDGSTLKQRPVDWTIDDSAVAEVSAEGEATGVAVGTAQVTAVCEGHAGTSTVKVVEAGAPYWLGRYWWTATAAAAALLVLWLAIRPGPTVADGQADSGRGDPVRVDPDVPDTRRPPPTQDTRERLAVNDALGRVEGARAEAVAAGADRFYAAEMAEYDEQRAEAEREVEGGNLSRALLLLNPLPDGYASLRDLAAARSEDDDARGMAGSARNSALQSRQRALTEAANTLFPTDWRALEQRRQRAESAYGLERFDEARSEYTRLAGDYRRLRSRASNLQGEALNAKRAAEARRQEAIDEGARERTSDRLSELDNQRRQADTLFGQRRYPEAQAAFERLAISYTQLKDDVVALAEAEAATERATTGPDSPSDEDVLNGMIDRFRRLFEQEDLNRIGSELYGTVIPQSDIEVLNYYFVRADSLEARIDRRTLRVAENTATAEIEMNIAFVFRGRSDDTDLKFRFTFASDPDGWKLRRVEKR
jgi:hypothetical protein